MATFTSVGLNTVMYCGGFQAHERPLHLSVFPEVEYSSRSENSTQCIVPYLTVGQGRQGCPFWDVGNLISSVNPIVLVGQFFNCLCVSPSYRKHTRTWISLKKKSVAGFRKHTQILCKAANPPEGFSCLTLKEHIDYVGWGRKMSYNPRKLTVSCSESYFHNLTKSLWISLRRV